MGVYIAGLGDDRFLRPREELEQKYEEEKQRALAALKARREAEERRKGALEETVGGSISKGVKRFGSLSYGFSAD